jgi:hypothetical protein
MLFSALIYFLNLTGLVFFKNLLIKTIKSPIMAASGKIKDL